MRRNLDLKKIGKLLKTIPCTLPAWWNDESRIRRLYFIGLHPLTIPGGEEATATTGPLEYDFRLEDVVFPIEISVDKDVARLWWVHKCFVEGKAPTMMFSQPDRGLHGMVVQEALDTFHDKGTEICLRLLNSSKKPLEVRGALVGVAVTPPGAP